MIEKDNVWSRKYGERLMNDISEQYIHLEAALEDFFQATEAAILLKDALVNEENQLLISEAVLGRNEAERKAMLAELTKVSAAHLFQADRRKREAAFAVEGGRENLKRLRDMMKIYIAGLAIE